MTAGGYDPNLGKLGVNPAGIGSRAGARFIDWIIAGIVGAIIFWLLDRATDLPQWVSVLPGAGFGFLYFVFFEVLTGSTPGKKVLGLHVNGSGGAPKPNIKDSALRNAYMLLNLIPWVGGLLWFIAAIAIAVTVSSSPTKQGWHDNLAGGTQVIKD
ncbi:RDD family protein [Nocardia puris]|uniref:Putative RDD family membrane protein YckC n=1 Tax=Nocardia puris TaxID=208602 RepID=A0A366DVV6_9NOCA|nr:RDD family protein [Nocardia puris]MBF6210045.1 RDD family protein [Nocardia puris]MBF6368236.1 RDD family protein [Nocardia puris]MBF6458045.1 RDD family protein [Nocardia puris]RBO94207.1 putative RDD family membrane protein YckC [Nocardia puris]